MTDLFPLEQSHWLIALVALLLLLWLVYRRRSGDRLRRVLREIGYDCIDGLVIPNGDEGEIQIDELLLTSQGLLIIDIKHVTGTVFGGNKMQEWTVIGEDRRYTFPNPQGALYDRMAAVRHIVRQVPVIGRLLFLDGAEFTKGVPDHVTDLDGLLQEFAEQDKASAKVKIDAFKPHWDLIRKEALGAQVHQIFGRRKK